MNIDVLGDLQKLRQAVLYVARKCEADPTFGSVKLNKILFAADIEAYRTSGDPITGAEYMKQPQGHALRQMLPILDALQREEVLAVRSEAAGQWDRRRPVVLASFDTPSLSKEDIALLDRAIERFWGQSAAAVTEWSHSFAGWQIAAEDGDTIPYPASLIDASPPTQDERAFGEEIARKRSGNVP